VRLKYEDNGEFNSYVDEAHSLVRIFEEDFDPSRILFELAPEAYRLYLAEYAPEEYDGGLAADASVTEPGS
jgi:hypothetical protein